MSHRFTDIKVRDQYIIGLTEVIAEIFGITEKKLKKGLYNELYGLDDEALINILTTPNNSLWLQTSLSIEIEVHIGVGCLESWGDKRKIQMLR